MTDSTTDLRLQNGQRFPTIEVTTLAGEVLTLPDDLEGKWGVLLFYRGHW